MADKIVVLKAGEIDQVGSPMDLYNHPATAFVAGFIGSPRMNIFEGEVAQKLGSKIYGIRPQHIVLSQTVGTWQGTVRHIEKLGADAIIHLQTTSVGPIVVRTTGDTPLRAGDQTWATPVSEKVFMQ